MRIEGGRFLITGGAGLVGSHIADLCADMGAARIVVLDNFTRGSRTNLEKISCHPGFRLVEGDVRDAALVRSLAAEADGVFHQAALRITQCAESPRECHEVLTTGTFNVLEAARDGGVKKIVAASSASVYGEPDSLPIAETAPFNNRTLYGAAKVANEQYLRAFNEMYGLPFVALRYFNIYGPRMDVFGVYTEVMVRWIERMLEGLPPVVHGDGKQTMDFVYVGDVALANTMAMESDVGDAFLNVAAGRETSLNELARLLMDALGFDGEPEHVEQRKVNPVRRRVADVEAARRFLGFEARTPLEEGLRRLVAWMKETKAGAKSA